MEKITKREFHVLCFDAETNGLWSAGSDHAFAIAATITDADGNLEGRFLARCPIQGKVNEWVEENVLPQLEGIPATHSTYKAMLKAFAEWYLKNKEGCVTMAHVAFPVETTILRDMHDFGLIGDWDAPFPLVDCSTLPEIGISTEKYNAKNGVTVDTKTAAICGGQHNPLYDCLTAAAAYTHWMKSHGYIAEE